MGLPGATVHRALLPCATLSLGLLGFSTAAAGQAQPAARAHYAVAYHAARGELYLVGGSTRSGDGYVYFDDVWSWDGELWTRRASLPFPRSSHRLVYHEQRRSLLLIGGGYARDVVADSLIREHVEGEWRPVGGRAELGRTEPEVCYDRARDRVVIFGGWDAANRFTGDTWEWSAAGLERMSAAGPAARAGHAFVFDPVGERCLLFGGRSDSGYLSDTWSWDGAEWRRLDVIGPSARWFPAAAEDRDGRRVVLFGGRGPQASVVGRDGSGDLGDTWAWDGRTWRLVAGEAGPSPRMGAKAAYAEGAVVLLGGRSEAPDGFVDHDDVWRLASGTGWVQSR